jgi:SOS-response transcriptional repressor LexA
MLDARPSKKQRELLAYLEAFIKQYGYGPSYREIMRALDYKSVSTVATHVDGLIARGLLRKKDNSARSLEVLDKTPDILTDDTSHYIRAKLNTCTKEQLEVIIPALNILELSELAAVALQKLARYK